MFAKQKCLPVDEARPAGAGKASQAGGLFRDATTK